MYKFLLAGKDYEWDWYILKERPDGVLSQACEFLEKQTQYHYDIKDTKYVHKYDDIYEQVDTVVTVDEQYIEWCKEGSNHEQEDGEFSRTVRVGGWSVAFDTLDDFVDFCVTNEVYIKSTDRYVWEDGSEVILAVIG